MTRDEFWTYVDTARRQEPEEPELGLRAVLEERNGAELTSFEKHFGELMAAAYRWDIWGAAYIQEGGCSDDGFVDFRSGLIANGRQVYEAVLANPDSLAKFDDVVENETFAYVASEVYEEKFDREMDIQSLDLDEPAGESWDFDDDEETKRRLPRLFAKYSS